MINTISDLLLAFKNKEQKLLKKYDIVKHPGLIGNMYEGLTKKILEKCIFQGLDLHISAGKIKNSKNEFSNEIDCMVVLGKGEKLPHTDKYIYDISKVIAVIEVKKNLFSEDIKKAHKNILSVTNVTEYREGKSYHSIIHRDSWRMIYKEELPHRENIKSLPYEKQKIYHTLLLETFLPTRIILGYNGFKSEFSLRESFEKYLEENLTISEKNKKSGFSPLKLPNLIICNNYSLIKANGIPFCSPIIDNNWWPFYLSSYENPVYFLLELIWTRLQYMFGITYKIFGEDLINDEMHKFLSCKYKEKKGWDFLYHNTKKDILEKPLIHKEWEPMFVNEIEFVIFNELCIYGNIDFEKNIKAKEYIERNGYTLESFIKSLKNTGLIDYKKGVLVLITEYCICGVTPNGKYFVGENKTGRVERWLQKKMVENDL